MQDSRRFRPAPWPTSLKASSGFGTVLLVGLAIASYRAIPVSDGFTHVFGLAITLVFPLLLAFSFVSVVTGYEVSSTDLTIHRVFWASRVSLVGLHRVFADPSVCKSSRRIIGNAGLFGFTGLYYSSQFGRFRLFGTDLANSVVLVLQGRVVVITPAAPHAFIGHIQHNFPATDPANESDT